ncbi:MAG TPA: DoxX family protein, partial [Casimicrobium sp.]|nr:DoxX family protein [Casimicrobium sp.]
SFPFLTLAHAIVVLRVATAIFFLAHAVVRIYNGTIPGFAEFLATRGWPMALLIVWGITVAELVSGVLLIVGRCVRWGVA